jgi:hypothetical protein
VGETRRDIVGRIIASAVLQQHAERGTTVRFRRLRVETEPAEPLLATEYLVKVYGDDAELGPTPATIEAHLGALRVVLPPPELAQSQPGGR